MGNIIDYTKFNQSYKVTQRDNTEKERQNKILSGMEEISKADFLQMLEVLNYKIDNSMCLNYYNNLNESHYLARSMYYTDKKTKQSAFHFEQRMINEANLDALQKIRLNFFVFDTGRIWDL